MNKRIWQGTLYAAVFGWVAPVHALLDNNQGNGVVEPKVQRPIGAGETVSPGSYSGDIHSNTERQIQEWDAKIADLRRQMESANDGQRKRLQGAIDDLEKDKRDIRSELRDLSVRIEKMRVDSQKTIQSRFRQMEKELNEIRKAE
jgi:hypothetical protein